jgi:GNAT superfamily N-acetyltransferase
MIDVRPLREADLEPLAAWLITLPLMQRYGLTAEAALRQLQTARRRGDTLITAADDADYPVGFAWMMPTGAFGRSPYLRLIGVHPDWSAQGIGARLLDAVESLAWSQADALCLLVSDFNLGAQRFYERHGYSRVGALADYVVPGVTELLYWKRRGAL